MGRRPRPLIDTEAAHDPAAHSLHRAVHVAVGLEDPAHLAPRATRHGRLVEVLDVQRRRHTRVLIRRLDAEETHAHAVHDLVAAQEVPPAERQQAAVHPAQHLVDVRRRDGDRGGVAVGRLGDHHPVGVEDELKLAGQEAERLLRVRREVPVLAPGRVVDLGEAVHIAPQRAAGHMAQRDAVARLELLGELEDDRQHLGPVGDHELPHEEVHRLGQAGLLAAPLIVGRVPRHLDQRRALEALDQDSALVVHREVHRADHAVAAARLQPLLGGGQQRRQDLGVVLELEEAEHPPARVVVGVEEVVELGADPPDDAPVAAGQEQLRVALAEERVVAPVEEQVALQAQRGHPDRRTGVQPERERYEFAPVTKAADRCNSEWTCPHSTGPYMPTAIDVFETARPHERIDQLRAAREADLLPYFRPLSSATGPVGEMEGAERIMLGSNNYLGLTGDERVIQGARDALERYGTGMTGSRLLNGTTALHLELEEEIADWQGTEDAIVFTTGHQANVGTLGTILAPGDTVIADSGDHASILDGCLLSRAKLRPFRHGRLDRLEKALERAVVDGGGVLVVVDSVFSMEGDVAPLPQIAELAAKHGARLMVDEAHGAGVLGSRGAGASELLGVEDRVDLRMGTFSKALASCGGFVAGPHDVIEYLRLQSRAFLFTAAAVPAAVGAALAALRIVRSVEGPQLMARVLDNARYLRDGLAGLGLKVVEHEGDVMTPV